MSGHLRPIKLDSYKPLRELVCENIRQAIIDGTFSPGERLMEIQLADEMGVSRTPVREAIRKLELEGFVVMIPRRGTYVADISIKDINDDELETLQRLLVEIGQHIEENNMDKIVEVDIAFHDVLYQASRNERLRNIINNLREQITVIRGRSMMYPGRLADTMEEHRALVDSIAARDVERAQNAARIHLENAEHTLLKDMVESHNEKKNKE